MLRKTKESPTNGNKRLHLTLSIPPSVNHCYTRNARTTGTHLTAVARNWKTVAGYLAAIEANKQKWHITPKGTKVVVELYAFWPDGRKRDMSNLHKLLPDAIEGIIYDNDCNSLIRDMDYNIDRNNPRVECIIYEFQKEQEVNNGQQG